VSNRRKTRSADQHRQGGRPRHVPGRYETLELHEAEGGSLRWLRYGNWPSEHDLDLILSPGGYWAIRNLARSVPRYVRGQVHQAEVPARLIPPPLLQQAIEAADGVDLDLILQPSLPLALGAWLEAPRYEVAWVQWREVNNTFFRGAVPLRSAADVAALACGT
jgi:hypothetical protein